MWFQIELIMIILQVKRYPSLVKIVEVGPRDGLQNEKVIFMLSYVCV